LLYAVSAAVSGLNLRETAKQQIANNDSQEFSW
jgi:hypothetical protein